MRQKFVSIQYLRGLAAILVLASHALLYPLVEHTLSYGRLGWMGVILFFVISGFIMVAVTGENRFNAVDFIRRRFVRIVPMYWAATLLAAALAFFAPSLFKTTVYDTGQLIQSLFFIPFYNPVSQGIHPLYKLGWTLNYEVFFYVCFALLAFLSAQARVIGLTVAFAGLAMIGLLAQPEPAIPQFYTSFMPLAFVAGAWIGLATLRGYAQRLPMWGVAIAAVIAVVGLVWGFTYDNNNFLEDGMAFVGLMPFAAALVLLAVRFESTMPQITLFELIGDASYSIYLVHIYEVAILSGIAFKMLDPQNMWADYFVSTVSVIGGTVAGIIIYKLVEMPVLKFFSGLFKTRKPINVAQPAE